MYEFKIVANYEWQNYKIEKLKYTNIQKLLKDIVIVINCCWQLKQFSYS